MANRKHLKVLKQGVERWNKWRKENSEVRPDLSEADLVWAHLSGADLSEVNLTGANLSMTSLDGADFGEAKLVGAQLVSVHVGHLDLHGANLLGADLRWANLSWANLGGAHLTGANLRWVDLSWANLRGADLAGANLRGADLGANFAEAGVGATIFADVDLSTAKGLETIDHLGPSHISIDTVYKSRGKIPEVFLRGCGVPDEFFAYIGSMVGRPIEFCSCFISYSTKDQEFTERLYADLQAKGVRCWCAREDLKIGDKFQERIEESIRWHDKLLLVLSENSILSPWVEREVQAAFEREDKSKKLVLFPIRLDETVMKTTKAWAADIRRTRHIGEFGQWREHGSYKKALERLLRDLKAGEADSG